MKLKLVAQAVLLASLTTNAFMVNADDNLVVVTANRFEQDLTDTLAEVDIILRADIERMQPQSLVDLLFNVSGIDSIQRGGHGQDSSLFVRGANSNQVLILIDGIRVGSATLGAKSISNISISQIERIEIVKGPRAALWGSDAIGGVIQVFTRRYQAGEHRIGVTLGSNATAELDASIGLGDETLNSTISVSHKQSDGFDVRQDSEFDDDGYKNNSVGIRGGYQLSAEDLIDWTLQADKGQNDFDTNFGGNVSHYNNNHWNLRYSQTRGDWVNQYAYNRNRDSNYSDGNGVTRDSANTFETHREQATILSHKKLNDSMSMSGGIEWLTDNIERTSGDFAETARESKSVQLAFNYVGKKILADLAARYDDVQRVSSETSLNFSAGYRLTDEQIISINYGEGFKAPTFNDLYYPFGGNSSLKFETSDNLELVYKAFFEQSRFSTSVYRSDIDNLIQWAPQSNGSWTPQNVGKAEVFGIDMNYQVSYASFSHEFSASHVAAEDASSNQQLLRRAKKRFAYEVSQTGNDFEWFAQLQYVGKRPDNDYQTFLPTELDSYVRVNLGVGYSLSNSWKLQLKVNDALDEAPVSVSGYNPIEREFYLTISHQNLL